MSIKEVDGLQKGHTDQPHSVDDYTQQHHKVKTSSVSAISLQLKYSNKMKRMCPRWSRRLAVMTTGFALLAGLNGPHSFVAAFSTQAGNRIWNHPRAVTTSRKIPRVLFEKAGDSNDELILEKQSKGIFNSNLLLGSMALLLLACLSLVVPAAVAIDHPVDFSHLNIPNPLPDADPRYFISGGICAAASHGCTTPIDVVKTRIQSEPEVFNQGLLDAATTIVKEDGPQTLLSGLVPTVLGYGFEGGKTSTMH